MHTNTQATRTPGSFNVWPEHGTGKWIVSRTVSGTGNEEGFAECWTEASARLIAAAPRAAPALRIEVRRIEAMGSTPSIEARAAIAKATQP